jgi:hypothetical protein
MTYNIPCHRRGDTWAGISSITILVNGVPVNLQNASAKIEFRSNVDAPVALTLSTTDGSILISQPLNGKIQIPPRLIEIPYGKYYYDLQVTFPNGTIKTYMSGTWEIAFDITE